MKKYIFSFILVGLLVNISTIFAADNMCIQVVQDAKNITTGECREFSTPCDIPSGWEKVDNCNKDTIVNGVNLGACKSYYDGCNNCSVGDDGIAACTMMACEKTGTPKCLDNNTDNQLQDLENKDVQDLKVNFKMQQFNSCENYGDIIKKFIKKYYDAHPNYGYGRGGIDIMVDDMSVTSGLKPSSSVTSDAKSTAGESSNEIKATDFSSTNIQVAGVDESEIIKTDGKYVYFYNEEKHAIFILKAYPAKNLQIAKIINVPASFNSPEIYINGNKLTIVANKNLNGNYGFYWFYRNQKTVVVTYNISDLNNLKIEKYYQVDGSVSKSRRIGKYVYILSESSFNFPYATYYGPIMKGQTLSLDENKLNSDFDPKKILPKKAELKMESDVSKQNVKIKGKKAPYNLSDNYVSKCADIEYVIPDDETLAKFDFTPSYLTLSIINTEDPSEEVKTKLFFGNVSEVYMSLENLYITSNIYTSYNFKCPVIQCFRAPCIQPDCITPVFYNGENTLIHKINITGNTTKYQASTLIPGRPLNQYSMDEKDSNFRIVTSSSYPERYTSVFVLDKNLKLAGKLTNIAKDENFQSSRFIGDKLYLVTFEQIDPLFVIDLKDSKNPKIMGELKIPGYSTYLHPYDETHLIGLGYDTKTNQWGGTVNNGLKIDLYDIADITKPKQQYSLTLGDQSSSSEALNNPRLFVWDSKNKILYLTATLYKNAGDKTNTYRNSDVFAGSLAIKIDKDSGIKELARTTHIDTTGLTEKRAKECAQYSSAEKPACQKIIGGGEYCPPVSSYVPEYCYESSPIGEYLASTIWNYSNSFILRNLYFDNYWLTISNSKVQIQDTTNNFGKVSEVELKK